VNDGGGEIEKKYARKYRRERDKWTKSEEGTEGKREQMCFRPESLHITPSQNFLSALCKGKKYLLFSVKLFCLSFLFR